jgi:hypothetical protein
MPSYPCPHCGAPLPEGITQCGRCKRSIFDKPSAGNPYQAPGANVRDSYDQIMYGSLLKKRDPTYFKVAALMVVSLVFIASWGAAAWVIMTEPFAGWDF